MKRLLSAAAAVSLVFVAASFAQTGNMMDDKTIMAPFFSDDTMKTLRTDEELKAEMQKMTPENQQKFLEECKKSQDHEKVYNDLCKKVSPQ